MPIIKSLTLDELREAKALIEAIFLTEAAKENMMLTSDAIEFRCSISTAMSFIFYELQQRKIIRATCTEYDEDMGIEELWQIKDVNLACLRELVGKEIRDVRDMYDHLNAYEKRVNSPRQVPIQILFHHPNPIPHSDVDNCTALKSGSS